MRGSGWLLIVIWIVTPAAQAQEWWERRDRVWQEGDEILAVGHAQTEEEAVTRAREYLAAALRRSLPELDPALAERSAVLRAGHRSGDNVAVRLNFPAAFGEACRGGTAWYRRGLSARESGNTRDALEALTQAVMQLPREPNPLHALGLQLMEEGYWGSAAVLIDAACEGLDPPPLNLLRARARVHMLMNDRVGATAALADLRALDPTDLEADEIEALAYRLDPDRPLLLTQNVVMVTTVRTLDAELAARFVAWTLQEEESRQALVRSDLGCDGLPKTTEVDGLRLGDLCAPDEEGRFTLNDRYGTTWTLTIVKLPEWESALAHAGKQGVAADLRAEQTTVWFGGLFPVAALAGAEGIDEGWLRTLYYGEGTIPDRVRLVLHLRWEGALYRLDLDGALGPEETGWPGMFTIPELVHLVLSAAEPIKGAP